MKKGTILSVALLMMVLLSAMAQSEVRFTGDLTGKSMRQAITVLEDKTGFKFYYQDVWLDSLEARGSYTDASIQQVLPELFQGTALGYHLMKNRVILTYNSVIVEDLPMLKAFQEKKKTQEVAKGLVFAREYQGQSSDESDLENYVFEIGNRNDLAPNGKATIAGYVRNSENQEPITGALVYIESPFTATSTDESGFYSLTIPSGRHTIQIQFVGMKTTQRKVVLFANGTLHIDMDVDVIALNEVTVESDRDKNIKAVQMGVSKINVEEVKTVPIVLGENDILKIASTKAGVQTVGEGAAGFNVRGGKADQNLILINDAPVYNASHFFGFFSVFNSDAIQNMELYKSGIPARFGGRLSSVFDIQAKAPSKEQFSGSGGVSPITSRLTLEIPLVKEQTSLLVGGRTTYSNWVLSNVNSAQFRDNRVSFYDLITQLDHQINDKNELTFSAYMSNDKFRLSSDTLFSFSNFSFRNTNGSLKWKHRFNDQFDAQFSAVHARYQYDLTYDESAPNSFTQDFGIVESSLKAHFDYYREETQKFSFGAVSKLYTINPGQKLPLGEESLVLNTKVDEESGLETSVYLSEKYEINERLSVYGGVRYTVFQAFGPETVNYYEEGLPKNSDTQTGSEEFAAGQVIKTYHGPEWRASARFGLGDDSSVKLSASRTRQYVHSMSNSASLSPTDTWRLSSYHLRPQTADQVSAGYYRNLRGSTVELSVETYYKWLQDLVDFKTGSTFLLNQNIERETLQGPGKSYGVELSLKKSGRLNGWFNYAYARTFIRLDGEFAEERVNGGQYFPTAYDKPHTVNLVANYKLTRRLSFSLNGSYNTGRPVTFPVAAFDFKGAQNIHFSDRNAFRIPDYFRLDLGINLEGNHKIEKLSHSFWSLSIYNLTGRDNPFSVFFDVRDGEVVGSQLIVFGNPIPTLSYNFKF
ncbi:TonB-dependent receptor [Marinoscillum furvescens]|uniref:TonB-dependent receptor-like protein n=1 Tax=Marinoscillum furvescens DSM 4134 TaxID=1122208 RepID=A0A3D9L7L5_MARFU|nr:TonB-dependent receptor [Marinoscillum furvescens]REE01513.1 TonB-dependent receptor-like protein [Marinoscillum furvescens DSM 4134]